jgi:hypothetical protein
MNLLVSFLQIIFEMLECLLMSLVLVNFKLIGVDAVHGIHDNNKNLSMALMTNKNIDDIDLLILVLPKVI